MAANDRVIPGRPTEAQTGDLAERAYRGGYCEGFIAGADAMEVLQRESQFDRKDAYAAVWTFWEGALATWRGRDGEGHRAPPPLKTFAAWKRR